MIGTLQGQFYGPSTNPASEVGAVFLFTNGVQAVHGGLVAGR